MSSTPDYNHSQDDGGYPYNGKVLLAAVVLLSIVIFIVLLLHVYARWFLRRRLIVAHVVSEPFQHQSLPRFPGHTDEVRFFPKGLDAKVVASLPTFVYKSKEHESALDCVVCLSVMEEDESGRILPKCNHSFHVGCIDMWLMSHSTCPICRAPVKEDESSLVVDDEESVVVSVVEDEAVVRDEVRRADGELAVLSGVAGGDVAVEIPVGSIPPSQIMKGDGSSSSSSSSLSCSLKRMLSKNRSESRVFPSVLVH